MALFDGINASASALTAQRLRMDVTSANVANADSTRGTLVDGEWEPYRRKMVAFEPQENFSSHLSQAMKKGSADQGGVNVRTIQDDTTPFREVYQPEHPEANEEGYVQLPNVDPLKEMVNMMGATRSYEANVTTMNATKNMMLKALEIGRN